MVNTLKKINKTILIPLVCGILVAALVFGAYFFGNSSGYTTGYNKGFYFGQQSNLGTGNAARDMWQEGYQAGLAAQNNGTG